MPQGSYDSYNTSSELVSCLFNDVFITQMKIRGMNSEDIWIPPLIPCGLMAVVVIF